MQQMIFIANLIACSTCFGHHYAHHQDLESITQVVAACRISCLVFKLSVWCGAEGCVSGLRAVPHINDDARSKPHSLLGFSWFTFVYKRMLRWFPSLQVATTCLSCSPPDLNFLVSFSVFVYM